MSPPTQASGQIWYLNGNRVSVIAADYGGYAVAFLLSQLSLRKTAYFVLRLSPAAAGGSGRAVLSGRGWAFRKQTPRRPGRRDAALGEQVKAGVPGGVPALNAIDDLSGEKPDCPLLPHRGLAKSGGSQAVACGHRLRSPGRGCRGAR